MLVVLDVTGVLCQRVYTGDGFQITIRPFVQEFLSFLYKNYEVAFFTSTNYVNANPIIQSLLTPEQKQKTKFFWYRDRTRFDPQPIESYDTIKMIQDIIDCPTINYDRRYTLQNILLVDDSPRKVRLNNPDSVILVNSYLGGTDDDELLKLIKDMRYKLLCEKRNKSTFDLVQ